MVERFVNIDYINENSIINIIKKINVLVQCYANKSKTEKLIYETNILIKKDDKYIRCPLKRINMELEFYNVGLGKVFNNSPFIKNKSLYDIIQSFVNRYYPGYFIINEFINKLLHSIPTKVTKKDFIKINTLYKIIKNYDNILPASEQIKMENK